MSTVSEGSLARSCDSNTLNSPNSSAIAVLGCERIHTRRPSTYCSVRGQADSGTNLDRFDRRQRVFIFSRLRLSKRLLCSFSLDHVEPNDQLNTSLSAASGTSEPVQSSSMSSSMAWWAWSSTPVSSSRCTPKRSVANRTFVFCKNSAWLPRVQWRARCCRWSQQHEQ